MERDVAAQAARRAIESTYEGIMTVTEHRKATDKKTHITGYEDVTVLKDQPCRLSYTKVTTATPGSVGTGITQVIKLFAAPDITIKPGSKMTVAQCGVTADYTYSGVPAVYATHQEIILEFFERWA